MSLSRPGGLTESGLEKEILNLLSAESFSSSPAPIFVLGSPRTGSTVCYQALCSRYGLPFIANLTNDFFADTPIVGLAIQRSVPVAIAFASHHGKTDGAFQPSEGSAVMARWFGGGHPSALVSARIINGMESHFLATLSAAEKLFDAPLVIKNAWNCFRVRYLVEALPYARFVWIRRDIAAAAKSDLAARYKTKGSATAWNSATPANIEKLKELPPPAQVLENQHEFNIAIGDALQRYAGDRWREVWYEDLVRDPEAALAPLGTFLEVRAVHAPPIDITRPSTPDLPTEDVGAIDSYLSDHAAWLAPDRYPELR